MDNENNNKNRGFNINVELLFKKTNINKDSNNFSNSQIKKKNVYRMLVNYSL